MDAAELRAWCLDQPGAAEERPFGPETSVFKVGGRMFALSGLDRDPLEVSVKTDPDLAIELRRTYDAVRPGWHLNKKHWSTVTLGADLPDQEVRDLVQDSYDLVVAGLPKRTRDALA